MVETRKSYYDLIIIGGGPAGLTAAVYAARRKLNTLVVAKVIGGQTAWSADIENYLGFNMISGPELVAKFYEHVKKFDDNNTTFDLELAEGVEVVGLKAVAGVWEVSCSNGATPRAGAVIIAAGKVPRMLKVPGEEQLIGHGVTFCATCDAPLYRGKSVAVIGGGNSALDATLQLAKLCPKVYVVTVNSELRGEQVMVDKVHAALNITVLTERQTVAVLGSTVVSGLTLQRTDGTTENLAVQGVFEEIGYEPATTFLQGVVELNDVHEVVVDIENRTSAPGVFAAGDITNVPAKQIIVAAGEGAKAVLAAQAYLIRNTE